ncbi:transferase family-domain-containing protein [Thelephora terrestris]|uniref:Transferase family-domain-containing protein n=1 Tax=Thelephora terrestris TaxID=56493 RepID=A0A9P6L9B2_9AGAM|nr:transferase family-domain-containing protein [Thelephora terrestris]
MSQPVVASVRVRPSTRFGLPRPDPVKIHALDLIVPRVWTPIYHFFPPVSQADHPVKETVLNLISSLADVLEHFPLLAGSLKPDCLGNLNIHSDNVGADFVYELRDEMFPGVHAHGLDPRGADIGFPTPGDPLVAVKFTAFTCGTYVLCIATHHVIADLASTMDFVYAYARRFAGKPYLSTVPKTWSREPLMYFDTPSCPVSSLPLLETIPGITVLPPNQPPPPPPLPEPTDLVQIYTTTHKLTQIKNAINSSASTLNVTTFQVLAALMWQAISRVAFFHLPEDEEINFGLAVNGRERAPTRAMVHDRFYGNFNPAVCVSLPQGELVDSDVAFIAGAIKKALKEQLEPGFIARKVKTLESVDSRRILPNTQCQLSSWPKDMMLNEDLDFGFKFIENTDDDPLVRYSPRRKRRVMVSAGDDLPFPVGTMQSMMLDEHIFKILVAVPRGMKDVMLDEVQAWSVEKPGVILTASKILPSLESQARL